MSINNQNPFHDVLGNMLLSIKDHKTQSTYYLFTPEEANKVIRIFELFFDGSVKLQISDWTNCKAKIAFQVLNTGFPFKGLEWASIDGIKDYCDSIPPEPLTNDDKLFLIQYGLIS